NFQLSRPPFKCRIGQVSRLQIKPFHRSQVVCFGEAVYNILMVPFGLPAKPVVYKCCFQVVLVNPVLTGNTIFKPVQISSSGLREPGIRTTVGNPRKGNNSLWFTMKFKITAFKSQILSEYVPLYSPEIHKMPVIIAVTSSSGAGKYSCPIAKVKCSAIFESPVKLYSLLPVYGKRPVYNRPVHQSLFTATDSAFP